MKKVVFGALAALALGTLNTYALGKTTLTAYGTYWDQDQTAYGAGLRASKSLLDMVYVDGRAGYLETDTPEMEMIPLETSLNVGLPGIFTPYIGVGAGYYILNSDVHDDVSGYFGQVGCELTLTKIGALAELRYLDLEGRYFDGVSVNVGLFWKF